MMNAGRRLGFVVVVTVLAGACASAAPTMSSRFIKQGTPTMDLGGPRVVSMRPAARAELMRKESLAHVPSAPVLDSLETSDPVLKDALAKLAAMPGSAQHLAVAAGYVRRGILDRAYDYLTRSLAINGPDPAVYDALARLWRDWGQPGEGLPHAYRAVYLDPQSSAAQNTLGTLLYKLGHRAEARASFARAAELAPTAWFAFANLCHVDMAAGNTRAAIGECQRATALRKSTRVPDRSTDSTPTKR